MYDFFTSRLEKMRRYFAWKFSYHFSRQSRVWLTILSETVIWVCPAIHFRTEKISFNLLVWTMKQLLHFRCPYNIRTIMEFVGYKIPFSKTTGEKKIWCTALLQWTWLNFVILQVRLFLGKLHVGRFLFNFLFFAL